MPVPVDPVAIQTYADMWLIRNGPDWVTVTEEMLIDQDNVFGRMTKALAAAGLLDSVFILSNMTYAAKLKQGERR